MLAHLIQNRSGWPTTGTIYLVPEDERDLDAPEGTRWLLRHQDHSRTIPCRIDGSDTPESLQRTVQAICPNCTVLLPTPTPPTQFFP